LISNKLVRTIIVIGAYLIICPGLYAQDSILSYLNSVPGFSDESFHTLDFYYNNLYASQAEDAPDGFANILYYKFGAPLKAYNGFYYAGYEQYKFRAKIKALSNEDDWMQFSHLKERISLYGKWRAGKNLILGSLFLGTEPGFLLEYKKEGRTQFGTGFGLSLGSADIDYDVNGFDGKVPFNWYQLKANSLLQNPLYNVSLNYSSTIPAGTENGFDNRLYLHTLSINASGLFCENTVLQGYTQYSYTHAKLYYNNDIYGKLDNLHSLYSTLQLNLKASSLFSYQAGTRFFLNRCGSDSYFDIWPFTYWDMFLAHRTRIKQVDAEFGIPFVAASYQNAWQYSHSALKIKMSLEYNQFFHYEDIIIRNRRVVVYPFLFSYDTDYYDIETSMDGFLFIPLSLSYQRWGLEAGIAFEQVVPVDWESLRKMNLHQEPSGSSKIRESGGTNIRLYINFPSLKLTD